MLKALLHLYLITLFLKIMTMHCFKCCRNEESTMKTKALCCCDRFFVDKLTIDHVFKWLLSNSWLTACQKQLMWFIIRCVLCCGNRAIVTLITLLKRTLSAHLFTIALVWLTNSFLMPHIHWGVSGKASDFFDLLRRNGDAAFGLLRGDK